MQRLVINPEFSRVIATRFINTPGSLWESVLGWKGLNTEDVQELAVSLPKSAHIIDKTTYSLPAETLAELLPKLRENEVYVAGVDTDICVSQISGELFDAGIAPWVLEDYTGSTAGYDHHKHGLRTLGRLVGRSRVVSWTKGSQLTK